MVKNLKGEKYCSCGNKIIFGNMCFDCKVKLKELKTRDKDFFKVCLNDLDEISKNIDNKYKIKRYYGYS